MPNVIQLTEQAPIAKDYFRKCQQHCCGGGGDPIPYPGLTRGGDEVTPTVWCRLPSGEEGQLCRVELSPFPCNGKNERDFFLVGNCLLQRAAGAGNEAAALFLATSGANANHRNKWVSLERAAWGMTVVCERNGRKKEIVFFFHFCECTFI